MVLQRGLVKRARSHEYCLIPLPLGRGRNVGLATPSVLPLSPSFTIWKQITELFWELQGMTRNKNPAASLFTTLTFFFSVYLLNIWPVLVCFCSEHHLHYFQIYMSWDLFFPPASLICKYDHSAKNWLNTITFCTTTDADRVTHN